jgi:hypothetical protein
MIRPPYVRVKHPGGFYCFVQYGLNGYTLPGQVPPNAPIVTPDNEALEDAYLCGSMFGWHVPGAELAEKHHHSY